MAKDRDEFSEALKFGTFDLIISDFSLPSYDGVSALSLAQELQPRTPFIFFSGTIGEEVAINSLQNGATDYVLKQRPSRLLPAIRGRCGTPPNKHGSIRLKKSSDNRARCSTRHRTLLLSAT